jgi:TRAP-type C4-dicarboxylate transport system permease small subunit
MKLLEHLARASAVLAGVLLVAITLMTCASLLGRNTTGWTIVGDVELTAVAAGAAVALFLPWCQVKRSHIFVDFFTARASDATRHSLDRIGTLLMALAMALLAWRAVLGGMSAWRNGSGSMMLGFPEWVSYIFIVAGLALAALVALAQTVRGDLEEATTEADAAIAEAAQ